MPADPPLNEVQSDFLCVTGGRLAVSWPSRRSALPETSGFPARTHLQRANRTRHCQQDGSCWSAMDHRGNGQRCTTAAPVSQQRGRRAARMAWRARTRRLRGSASARCPSSRPRRRTRSPAPARCQQRETCRAPQPRPWSSARDMLLRLRLLLTDPLAPLRASPATHAA